MLNCKIIAVSQRVDLFEDISENRNSVDDRLLRWIIEIGFAPLQIPNILGDDLISWINCFKPMGFVLSGGQNFGINKDRDRTETILLKYASSKKIPVLGICRGMQILGLYDGGVLDSFKDHVGVRHPIKGYEVSLGRLPKIVNSYHNFGFKKCPASYNIIAKTSDGSIEAVSHKRLSWEGWMFHPEREKSFDKKLINRASKLFLGD